MATPSGGWGMEVGVVVGAVFEKWWWCERLATPNLPLPLSLPPTTIYTTSYPSYVTLPVWAATFTLIAGYEITFLYKAWYDTYNIVKKRWDDGSCSFLFIVLAVIE